MMTASAPILRSLALGLMLVGSSLPAPLRAATPSREDFKSQAERCRSLLQSSVIRFYLPQCVDRVHGGYLESLKDDVFAPTGEKFLTLQARQLWTFSTLAAEGIQKEEALAAARTGFEFLEKHFLDSRRGGYYSKVGDAGAPVDTRKHAYLNSFALYGLVAYHRATGDARAMRAARELFKVLETRFHDARNGGYNEFFHADWTPVTESKEGGYVGALGTKTYNTHLHLLESLAELYRSWPDPLVARRLQELIIINTSTVMDPVHHCNLDGWRPDWIRVETPQNRRASYGHDVECVWLVLDAASTVGMSPRTLRSWAEALAGYSLDHGYDRVHGGFFYTGPLGGAAAETRKEWWVQAEALVGMLTLYQMTGNPRYYEAFRGTLDFIEKYQVCPKGSWYATLQADGSGAEKASRTSLWQGAYHNGRALLQSARLLDVLALESH